MEMTEVVITVETTTAATVGTSGGNPTAVEFASLFTHPVTTFISSL